VCDCSPLRRWQASGSSEPSALLAHRCRTSQFSTPDGSPVPEKVTRDSSGAFPITFAEFRGTYRRGMGAGMADSVRTAQALVAAIAETPRGTMFIQLFGAAARVANEREEFIQFVRSLR
jgi:hypothetical protein